jgi:Flp pilus assembly protein TadG
MVLKFRTLPSADRREDRGAVAIMVAVLASVLFVIAALVVDLGLGRDTKRQSQNAADASALAAGNVLYETDATCSLAPCFDRSVAEAKEYAQTNFGVDPTAWGSCTDSTPLAYIPASETGTCISFDQSVKPTQVRVVVPTRSVDTGLGVVAGVETIDISTVARATINPEPVLPCGLCVLGSGTTHNLQNGDAFVDNGNAHFNGNVNVSANGLVVADGDITVEGTASGPNSNYTPDPTEGVSPIEDPLGYIPLPPAAMASLVARTNPCTQGPGIYTSQDLRNATCTLSPGLYVIRSGVWDLAGNSSTVLRGSGVTLYFTCSDGSLPRACNPGEAGATMDFSGNGRIEIDAPTSGPLAGLAIVYDRNNTSTLRFTGNGSGGMSGAVYAPSAKLLVNGNGCGNAYESVVVVQELEFNGNPACLRVDYDEDYNPSAEPGELHLDQ